MSEQRPSEGGSYVRQPDGSLKRVDGASPSGIAGSSPAMTARETKAVRKPKGQE
jgi:hypothetical protein